MKITFEENESEGRKQIRQKRKNPPGDDSSGWGIIWRVILVCICIDGPVWAYFHFVENVTVWEGLQNIREKIHGERPQVIHQKVERTPTISTVQPTQRPQAIREYQAIQPPQKSFSDVRATNGPGQMDQAEADYVMAVNLLRNDRVPEAIEYYRKSARAGNIKAQRALAELANRER